MFLTNCKYYAKKLLNGILALVVFLFLLLAVVNFFVSCDSNEGMLGGHNETNVEAIQKDYKIIEIEGCEYIVYDSFRGYTGYGFMAHKGNCKNPIHEHNK